MFKKKKGLDYTLDPSKPLVYFVELKWGKKLSELAPTKMVLKLVLRCRKPRGLQPMGLPKSDITEVSWRMQGM